MIVLVDYDNLPRLERKRGLIHVATKIVETIGSQRLRASARVRLKLYGGWLENNSLSPYAQRLSADVQRFFPRAISVVDSQGQARVIVRVDIGYSLEIEPAFSLSNTFRRRGVPKGLTCAAPPVLNCGNPANCAVSAFHSFVTNDECSDQACSVPLKDILTRHEQKLVDTMIVADLIYLASSGSSEVVLVSSDDDLWTGIKSALLIGTSVLHIQTMPQRRTPVHYSRGAGANYLEINLIP